MGDSIEKLKLAFETITDVVDKYFDEKVLKADSPEVNRRLDICKYCEEFVDSSRKCRVCSCYMDLKAHLIAAKCPIDKW